MLTSNDEYYKALIPLDTLERERNILRGLHEVKFIQAFIQAGIEPKWFHSKVHQYAAEKAINFYKEHGIISIFTLHATISQKEETEAYEGQFFDIAVGRFPLEYVEDEVIFEEIRYLKDNWVKREMQQICYNAARELGLCAIDEAYNVTRTTIDSLQELLKEENSSKSGDVVEGLANLISDFDSRGDLSSTPKVYPTGLADFDNLVGGIPSQGFTLIAGRPGMGKTLMGVNVAHNIARYERFKGKRVLFCSLELNKEDVISRFISKSARETNANSTLSAKRLMRDNKPMTDPELSEFYRLSEKLIELPITIYDKSSIVPSEIEAEIRSLNNQFPDSPVGMVIIDHVTIMKSDKSAKDSVEMTKDISEGLRSLAKNLNIAVVGLIQLNRNNEAGQNKRPALESMRNSGSLEQDAELVVGIFRDDYYAKDETGKKITSEEEFVETELIILKNRNGKTGTVDVLFNLPFGLVCNKGF